MEPTIQLIYFSPTGSTRNNINYLINGFGGKKISEINLTDKKQRDQKEYAINGDIIFIGVPVYSSTIPIVLQSFLQKIHGQGKWVVLVITYGNVRAGTCLQNLAKIVISNGFSVLGAVSAIGQHSFCCEKVPLAKNRPDSMDQMKMIEFGKRLREKYENNPFPLHIDLLELPPPKPRPSLVLVPNVKEDLCTKCMKCVDVCPVAAIDLETLAIVNELCILCCACVRVCEPSARIVEFEPNPEKIANFLTYTKIRLEPELLL